MDAVRKVLADRVASLEEENAQLRGRLAQAALALADGGAQIEEMNGTLADARGSMRALIDIARDILAHGSAGAIGHCFVPAHLLVRLREALDSLDDIGGRDA